MCPFSCTRACELGLWSFWPYIKDRCFALFGPHQGGAWIKSGGSSRPHLVVGVGSPLSHVCVCVRGRKGDHAGAEPGSLKPTLQVARGLFPLC